LKLPYALVTTWIQRHIINQHLTAVYVQVDRADHSVINDDENDLFVIAMEV